MDGDVNYEGRIQITAFLVFLVLNDKSFFGGVKIISSILSVFVWLPERALDKSQNIRCERK